jgi:threonine dehydrogenase-like Zn-dependent dehydrogenase
MINCTTRKRSYGWDTNGAHAELMLTDARNCLVLPDALTFADGAHAACGGGTAYQALRRLDVSGRDRLAIFGVGPVGLGAVMLAKAMDATVYAVDLVAERVRLARELGADVAINATDEDPLAILHDLTGGEGVEAAMDCSADPAARNQTLDCARVWGRVVWVGEGHATTINPSPQMLHKQLTVMGTWVCGLVQLEDLARFMVRRDVTFEPMVTHRFPLSQIEEGLRLFDTRRTGKIIIEPH